MTHPAAERAAAKASYLVTEPNILLESSAAQSITAEYAPLEKAARELEQKMAVIENDERYQAVWMLSYIHGSPYAGPTWEHELARLRAALKEVCGE
jgi:hypothetical protein